MSDYDGNLAIGTQAITNVFKKYFEKMLKNTQVVNQLGIYEQIIYDTV